MRVLGLDISKEGVASVEIESAFGRYEIRDTKEIPIDSDTDLVAYPPASIAHQLIASLHHAPDRVITALPTEFTTFRNLQLATRDKKAIKAALEYELEDDLPFEKDECQYDSVILESSQQGSLIHIGASKKENVALYLKPLETHGIDPDVVTTDAWAYRSLFSRIKDLPDSVLLFGFEQTKTFFYIHAKNKPVLYREIPFGLATIERKLKSTFSASPSEINTWIRDIGVTGIDENVSNEIADLLELLVPELKQTELAARSQMQIPIAQIYVTGSGALMPGFLTWLEEAAMKPVALFKPLSLVSPAQVSYSDMTEVRFSRALALALVNLPADKLTALNFRKGVFSKLNEDSNSPIELIKKPLPYLLITLFVFFMVKSVEYKYYTSKLADTDESLRRSAKNYYPKASEGAIRTYLSNIPGLKKTIESDLTKQRELAKLYSPNPNSPLEFLKTISQKIGKDIVLDMVAYDVGSEYVDKFTENKPVHASLTFVLSNPQLMAKLSDIMEKTFNFKKGDSEEVKFEGHKAYKIIYTGVIGQVK
jgi:Tfp pilus assembly PilM family ATPase